MQFSIKNSYLKYVTSYFYITFGLFAEHDSEKARMNSNFIIPISGISRANEAQSKQLEFIWTRVDSPVKSTFYSMEKQILFIGMVTQLITYAPA